MATTPLLFTPMELRGVTLPNRIVLSPLCMYSATDGIANEWHFAHLSAFARGGAGLVFTEATGVEPRGRISGGCCGIWNDEQAEACKPINRFIESEGSVPAIQLAHAGRKGSVKRPWEGRGPIEGADPVTGAPAWEVVAPSAELAGDDFVMPRALGTSEIADIVDAFAAAAKRSVAAGFRVLEIHGAHGYLIHSFLSPLSNHRNDAYGGDIAGRMRFPLEVAEAVRAAWPDDLPLFYRISAVDGTPDGWTVEDSVIFARALAERGVDVVDCSAGGVKGAPHFRANDTGQPLKARTDRGPGFQVPYAERVRAAAEVKTMAVGVIIDPHQAEAILAEGRADLVALGRELMYNPFWPLHAAQALGIDPDFERWPDQYAWAVTRRAQIADFEGLRDRR